MSSKIIIGEKNRPRALTTGRSKVSVEHNQMSSAPARVAVHDPHNLRRFTSQQTHCFARALTEIEAGRKASCWWWYVFPTAPWIVDGTERGSGTNRRYALRGDDAALAYMHFTDGGVDLGANLLQIMTAVRDRLGEGVTPLRLVGGLDVPKLKSCALLFERITRGRDETICAAMHPICDEVLRLLKVKRVTTT